MNTDFFPTFAGCGHLWVTDGIWKTVFPHCMFRVEVCGFVIDSGSECKVACTHS